MYNKIIIASALDQGFNQKALKAAKALLSENGRIVAIHIIEPNNNVVQSFVSEKASSNEHDTIKNLMAERISDDQNIETAILTGHAGRQISKYAKKVSADCIIVGSHQPGLEDFFLGSTASRVARYATCSVHVLR